MSTIDARALDVLFREARTHNGWQDKPVPENLLHELFDLAKMAPTSANCSPMRVVFVTTPEGKARLKPALSAGNPDKTIHDLDLFLVGMQEPEAVRRIQDLARHLDNFLETRLASCSCVHCTH